jgi:rsbT co-antagonist protein RsbR
VRHAHLAVLESLPDAVFAVGETGAFVYVNAAARQLGASDDGSLASLAELFGLDAGSAATVQEGVGAALEGEHPEVELQMDRLSIKIVPASAEGARGALVVCRDVTAQRAAAQAFHDSEERFRLISELSTEGLVLTERGVIFHVNEAMTTLFGYTREELIGMSAVELTAKEDREHAAAHIRSGSEEPYEARGVRKDGATFVGSISGANLPYQGRLVRGTRIRDISAQRQADEARRQSIAQEEKLRVQAERLAEMSTPLIWITKEILAMPLVGTMDVARARQALKTMLDGIAKSDAHTAIVDITGMSGVDTGVVSSLVRLAQAVRLQGAQVVLTGIRPQVADTLVMLDVNLAGIMIKGSFHDGIRYAMKRGQKSRMAPDLD